jgi:uncharacterized membrane protein YdjX (TVP38/TMEM64 family)
MPTEEPQVRRKLPLAKLSILALAAAAGGFLVLRGVDYHALADRGMALIRTSGPWAFFLGVALLPALGAPLSAFSIVAGEAFGPRMTIPGVIAAALAAIAVNLMLTYWLARFALRPMLSRLVERYGYKIPRVTGENQLSIALLVRLTPGPPYFIQSYILGLAEVPFRLYMIVSWLSLVPWTVALVVLGEGIFKGNFKLVFYGAGVIVAAAVAVHMVRKRYAARPD